MSSALKNLSTYDETNMPSAEGMAFGIVVAEWHSDITFKLYDGAVETLLKHGAKDDDIHSLQVPGTFELPAGARLLSQNKKLDAVICIGCVIKGETSHNEYINTAVAQGLVNLSIASGKPYIFGVLTPNTYEQAADRAGGKHGNKGVEAAATAIRMAAAAKELKQAGKKGIGFQV